MKTFRNETVAPPKKRCLRGVLKLAWKWQRRLRGSVSPEQSRSKSEDRDWAMGEGSEPREVSRARNTRGSQAQGIGFDPAGPGESVYTLS